MAGLRGPTKKNGPLRLAKQLRILRMGVSCGEIQKGKRMRESDGENENKEERRAEEIKVWDRYTLSVKGRKGKGEEGMRIWPHILWESTQSPEENNSFPGDFKNLYLRVYKESGPKYSFISSSKTRNSSSWQGPWSLSSLTASFQRWAKRGSES